MAKSARLGVKLEKREVVHLSPHPLACATLADFSDLLPRLTRPLAADLFCGAGGMSLGLQEAGFDVVLGVDHDPFSLETHANLFPGLTLNRDLSKSGDISEVVELLQRTKVDLVAGGPPCQPFSRAGKALIRDLVRRGVREEYDTRRDLWESFLEIVLAVRPPAMLMENVPDMALNDRSMILRELVDELEASGYRVWTRIVDAWKHGVPQFRHRLIVVAMREGHFEFPEPVVQKPNLRAAIGDLPPVEGGWRPEDVVDGWLPYTEEAEMNPFVLHAREGLEGLAQARIYDHFTRPVRADDRTAFQQMEEGAKYTDVAPELRRYRTDIFDDKYKRLSWATPSRTITAHIAKDGYWYIHPEQPRTLTVREAARLQTFPDRVRFAGPPTAAFSQIGNAVPPALASEIGSEILKGLKQPQGAYSSTRDIADRLRNWIVAQGVLSDEPAPLSIPWLQAATPWQVIAGELLLSRTNASQMRIIWRRLLVTTKTPRETLQARSRFEVLGEVVGERRVRTVLDAAEWFDVNPGMLSTSSDDLACNPYVSESVAQLAELVVTAPGRPLPVLVNAGTLRVAARFRRAQVDETNRLTDGRLEIARMVGMDERVLVDDPSPNRSQSGGFGRLAHLGLLELADRLCFAGSTPDCDACPLSTDCPTARDSAVQLSLHRAD